MEFSNTGNSIINQTPGMFDNYRGETVRIWMIQHPEVPTVFTIAYLALVLYVPVNLMNEREPMQLRNWNRVWNLLITIFSFAGAYQCIPTLYKSIFYNTYHVRRPDFSGVDIRHGSLYNSICDWHPMVFYDGTVGAFICAFILSKIPEMIDTVFLVLQKKKIIFLHWYHHVTVMLFCWHAYCHPIASGLIFAGMNYGVHSIMYFYYLICSFGYRRYVRPIAPAITFLQIAQMIVGLMVEIYSLYHIYFSGKGCESNAASARLGFLMYLSYFVLFSKLFKDNYLNKTRDKSIKNVCVEGKPLSNEDRKKNQ